MEEVIQKELHGNGILFIRSATVGNRNLAMLWGGDNESNFSPLNGLPTVVTAGLGAGLSGMPLWTADLGGYLTPESAQRPAPAGALDRVRRLFADHGVVRTSNRGPWDFGEEARHLSQVRGAAHEPLSLIAMPPRRRPRRPGCR